MSAVRGGVAEHACATAADEQRERLPNRTRRVERGVDERHEATVERHPPAAEQRPRRFDDFDHSPDSIARGGVLAPGRRPFPGRVARADAEDRTTGRHDVECRRRVRERDWLPHAGVDDAGTEREPLRDCRRRGERDERRGCRPRVVGDVQRVEARGFDVARQPQPRRAVGRERLDRDAQLHGSIAPRPRRMSSRARYPTTRWPIVGRRVRQISRHCTVATATRQTLGHRSGSAIPGR